MLRHLWLGLTLLAATSGVLLVSDRGRRDAETPTARIAIFQHASQAIVDEGVEGMIAALDEAGFVDGETASIRRFNAENDIATANSIAQEIVSAGYDLILTATTLSLQAVARANAEGRVNHVFGLVTDPAGAGVGIGRGDPLDHPAYMAGIGTMQPIREGFELAKDFNPQLQTIGVAWNPAEANSEANVVIARAAVQEMGLELLEASVDSSSAVFEATSSLVARGVDAIWVGGDVTVIVALDSVVSAARRGRIPVFTNIPGSAEQGSMFDVGADYFEVGRITGGIGADVLRGTDPATIPVRNEVPEALHVNTASLNGLKAAWRVPDEVLARAARVIEDGPGSRR